MKQTTKTSTASWCASSAEAAKKDAPKQEIPVPPGEAIPSPIEEPVDPENPDLPIQEDPKKPKLIV